MVKGVVHMENNKNDILIQNFTNIILQLNDDEKLKLLNTIYALKGDKSHN